MDGDVEHSINGALHLDAEIREVNSSRAAFLIVDLANPLRVVAFGSRARGDHRRDSDLDLAVIVEKYDPKVDKRPIWRADLDEWMDMDVLVYDVERERLLGESPVSLQHEVLKQGILLFDRQTGTIDRAAAARLV